MQKLKSDIQKTILDAAEYLFIRKGYKNTAMREIRIILSALFFFLGGTTAKLPAS